MHISSDIFRPFRRPEYRLGCPNSGNQNTLFQFSFFSCISTKKYVEVAIYDFTMHLNILKWLRTQNCRQKRKRMRQRSRSKRRNCQRKCYHSFKYLIDNASICFFFYINSLHCFVWFLLFYLLQIFSSNHFAALFSLYLYKVFIWIYEFFKNHPKKDFFISKAEIIWKIFLREI